MSEEIAIEIIDGGELIIGSERLKLTCDKLRHSAALAAWVWRPGYGMRCDDLATIASKEGKKLLFVSECKGTTRRQGLSRNDEGKMFYQLARTSEKMIRSKQHAAAIQLGGVISVVINYYQNTITMNVCGSGSSMAQGLPDAWMYPQKDIASF